MTKIIGESTKIKPDAPELKIGCVRGIQRGTSVVAFVDAMMEIFGFKRERKRVRRKRTIVRNKRRRGT